MYRDRVLRVVEVMEVAPDEKFDMRTIFSVDGKRTQFFGMSDPGQHTCGSAACVAGWAVWASRGEIQAPDLPGPGADAFQAGKWLGLTTEALEELFMPAGYLLGGEAGFTRRRALAVLRDMAAQHDSGVQDPYPYWEWYRSDGSVSEQYQGPWTAGMEAPHEN